MSETVTETQTFFETPAFKDKLETLQRADNQLIAVNEALKNHVFEELKSPDSSENETWDRVGVALESLDGHDDEDYQNNFYYDDFLSGLSAGLYDASRDADRKRRGIASEIYELGEQSDLNQFAAFGLRRHLLSSGPRGREVLIKEVQSTEANFQAVDELLVSHIGELMIAQVDTGISAAIVQPGGLVLEDDMAHFPVSNVFSFSPSFEMKRTYEDDKLRAMAHLADKGHHVVSPDELAQQSLGRGWSFVFNILPDEIPEEVPDARPEDADYYRQILQNMRRIAKLVLDH